MLPHRIATLLYMFDGQGRVLLMERRRPPNQGLWSPPGGKLKTDCGESPFQCGVREAREETGVRLEPSDLRLTGLIGETAYQGEAHWLLFLFEVTPRLAHTPAPHREGRFEFVSRDALERRPLPDSDRKWIWPAFWRHRGGFFAAALEGGDRGRWILEESRPAQGGAR